MTAAEQHRVLSGCEWTGEGKVVVRSTLATRGLLQMAGIQEPRVLVDYAVAVKRVWPGLLTVDRAGARKAE